MQNFLQNAILNSIIILIIFTVIFSTLYFLIKKRKNMYINENIKIINNQLWFENKQRFAHGEYVERIITTHQNAQSKKFTDYERKEFKRMVKEGIKFIENNFF